MKCGADIDPLFDQSFSPADAAERTALVAAFRTVVDACARDSGAMLPHISTVDTARDLDRIRAAIGDRKLTYVGESYGTYLGTIYATLFPEQVRAIVLDGAIDPTADGTAVALGQARGFEGALDDFLADCAKQRGCAFYHDGKPGAAYDALRARAERTGLPTVRNAGRTVNGTRFDAAVIQGLYAGRAGWRSFGDALSHAEDGDASTLLAMADSFVGRNASGMEHDALDALLGHQLPRRPAGRRRRRRRAPASPRHPSGAPTRCLPRELQPRVLDLAGAAGHRTGSARRRRRAAAPRGRHHR